MALVLWKYPQGNVEISRRMFAPKRVTEISAWYKAARKVIPQIPSLEEGGLWYLRDHEVSLNEITYVVRRNDNGDLAYVKIDRRQPGLGT